MDEEKTIMILNGEKIELHPEEKITDETLAELSGGKGGGE